LRKNVPTGKCFAVCSWLNMKRDRPEHLLSEPQQISVR
jgi:hypothetical protein